MSDEKILELKSNPSVIAYLTFLQDNITRMNSNSSNVKALVAVIYTIFVTVLCAVDKINLYWYFGIIIIVLGVLLDSYYLGLEKMYRTKFNNFVNDLNNGNIDVKKIYDMKPKNTNIKSEVLAELLSSMFSFSVLGFYIMIVAISVLLVFIGR